MGNVGRIAIHSVIAMNRMATLAGYGSDVMRLREDSQQTEDPPDLLPHLKKTFNAKRLCEPLLLHSFH